MKSFALALLLLSFSLHSNAQHQHAAPDKRKAVLLPGSGKQHHPVSTKNRQAQQFFDQGLVQLYGFNHDEARRSFARAAELDPRLALAHWGVALAVGPNYNEAEVDQQRLQAAAAAIARARALAGRATAQERDYIEALAKRFDLKMDVKKLPVNYKDAMAALHQKYPDDLDAATLYAESLMDLHPWQLWTKDGQPNTHTEEIVRILESVLKRDPQHIGANHYYIHAVEASRTPDRALPSAERLGQLAPAAGHLVHMPAHIYLRTGDYEASAKSNEAAAETDRAYIKSTGATGMYPAMYYSHNLHFLVESYNRSGQFRRAANAARQLEENVRGYVKEMPMLEGFLPSPFFVLLRFARWDQALKAAEPAKETLLTHAFWHYARGVALAATGKIAEAQQARAAFLNEAKVLPGETPFGLNTAASVLKIAENVLDARLAWAQGRRNEAVVAWRNAVAAEDALNYDEPPGWYYQVRESLGAALLLNGEAAAAERIFREDLELNRRSGRSLFGLLESLKAQGKMQEEAQVQKEFDAAWRNADTKLRLEDF